MGRLIQFNIVEFRDAVKGIKTVTEMIDKSEVMSVSGVPVRYMGKYNVLHETPNYYYKLMLSEEETKRAKACCDMMDKAQHMTNEEQTAAFASRNRARKIMVAEASFWLVPLVAKMYIENPTVEIIENARDRIKLAALTFDYENDGCTFEVFAAFWVRECILEGLEKCDCKQRVYSREVTERIRRNKNPKRLNEKIRTINEKADLSIFNEDYDEYVHIRECPPIGAQTETDSQGTEYMELSEVMKASDEDYDEAVEAFKRSPFYEEMERESRRLRSKLVKMGDEFDVRQCPPEFCDGSLMSGELEDNDDEDDKDGEENLSVLADLVENVYDLQESAAFKRREREYSNNKLMEKVRKRAKRLIKLLPKREKEVLELRFGLYGRPLTLPEVAHKVGVTVGEVDNIMRCALANLLRLQEDEDGNEFDFVFEDPDDEQN